MNNSGFLPRGALQSLLDALAGRGYRTIGPQVRDKAIQYLDLAEVGQLPAGWTDDQAPGSYHLSRVESPRCFAWATGPQALKPYLFRSREVLWQAERDATGKLDFSAAQLNEAPVAIIGARACDLAALALQDRHFLGAIRDPYYAARRDTLFIVVLHCAFPADTCFCASTGDGPRAKQGFDLALSELDDGFLVEVGTERGADVAAQLPLQPSRPEQHRQAEQEIEEAAHRQFRQLPSRDMQSTLFERLEHPRWDAVAARCLSCGNCTSVCPTCFCHAEQDVPALGGAHTEHVREWDSCFSVGHSHLHGFVVRPETRHRYRQWLTHKLGSWHTQYGRSGCVGCGRCITWCPVGIDITEEANAITGDEWEPRGERMNPYLPREAEIIKRSEESPSTVSLLLRLTDGQPYDFAPGQFNMLYLYGCGEVAISVVSDAEDSGLLMHTIRALGRITRGLAALKPGSRIGLRGPFGRGWPMTEAEGQDVVIVTGGLGCAPSVSVIHHILSRRERYGRLSILQGVKHTDDLIWRAQYDAWSALPDVEVLLAADVAEPGWRGHVGLVTTLFDRLHLAADRTLGMLCGPEVMMRAGAEGLQTLGLAAENIYLSMERNMQCAVGHCGHCQIGPHFVCRDGPVFRWPEVRSLLGTRGF